MACFRGLLFTVVCCSVVVEVCCITVEAFYSFGEGSGDSRLFRNDDGSSEAITLRTEFPFFDQIRRRVYVNTNGVISFTRQVCTFTPQAFPLEGSLQLIAPYWADVDTRPSGSGNVWYRETSDPEPIARARSDIMRDPLLFPEVDFSTFFPTSIFIATWDHVGYFNQCSDETNTFQCVLVSDGRLSFVIFLYAEGLIQWTTGDASGGTNGLGGTPAQVGFNSGNGRQYASVRGSRTPNIVNIDDDIGNTGVKGVWVFRVDDEDIRVTNCTSLHDTTDLVLLPNRGHILGGTSVIVTGPCFDESLEYTCQFGTGRFVSRVRAVYLDERRLLCVSPLMTHSGNVGFRLRQEGETAITVPQRGENVPFHSLSFLTAHQVNLGRDNLLFIGEESVSLTWLRDAVFPVQDPDNYTVDIWLYRLSQTHAWVWVRTACLATNIPNSGSATVTFPQLEHSATDPRFSAVAIQVALNSSHAEAAELPTAAGLWTTVAFATDTPPTREECNEWAGDTSTRMAEQAVINSRTPACPCTVQQAQAPNSGFTQQNMGSPMQLYFNPGAAICFYQSQVNPTVGPGRQCCYDERGRLNKGPTAGGHSDVSSVYSEFIPPSVTMAIHLQQDITPFIQCCKTNLTSCTTFYTFRPSAESECPYNINPPPAECAQLTITTFPDILFQNNSGVHNIVEQSVIWLYCTANSSKATITWTKDGVALVNDPAHIRIRSSSSGMSITSSLVVDNFQSSDNGSYVCQARDEMMTVNSSTLSLTASTNTLTVVTNPAESNGFPDNRVAVTVGNSQMLRCVGAGSFSPPSVVWVRNGEQVVNGSRITIIEGTNSFSRQRSSELQITNFSLSDAGVYQCIFTEGSEVITTTPLRLDTGDVMLERISPQVIVLDPPEKLVIETRASGGYRQFDWTRNDNPFTLAQGQPFTISIQEFTNFFEIFVREPTTTSDLGMYEVDLVLNGGSQTPKVYFNVTPYSVPTTMKLNDTVTVREGDSVNIACFSNGNPVPTISWYHGTSLAPFSKSDDVKNFSATLVIFPNKVFSFTKGSITSVLQITNAVYPAHDGVYTCVGLNSNRAGNNTNNATITVQVQAVDCGTLTNPANGQIGYSGRTTFRHTATYSCNAGYNLVGGSTWTCLATGVWSGSAPTCQPVDCGTLSGPANGRVSHTAGTIFGHTATYSCHTGYNLVGGSTRTCQAAGVWSGSAPTCQVVDCGTLTNPANGRVSYSGRTTFRQTANYSCNAGYNLVGDSIRICQATGVWSASEPTCHSVDCGTLSGPANGRVSHTAGTTFGHAATYSCNISYNLLGDSTRTCQATGVWSGSAPTCYRDVRFSLRGTPYQNNSFVFLEDIGDGDDALLCITNQTACCIHLYTGEEGHAMGNWFFPNGTRVPSHTANETSDLQWDLYSTRGEMVVHMHRRRGGEDGIYRCEIPDAMGINQTIYIGVYTRTPPAPRNVIGAPTGSTSLSLYWSPPPSQHQSGSIQYYHINVTDATTTRQFTTNNTELTVSSLHPYSTYRCTVAAFTLAQGLPSIPIMIQTYQDVPSGPPLSVIAVASSLRSVFLSWDPPSTLQRNGIITSYQVHVIVAEIGRQFEHTVETTYYNVTASITPQTTYNLAVAARTVNGTGPFSNITTVRTLEDDTTELVLLPNRGHILGGTSVIVTGPCFDDSLEYTCQFGTGRFVSGARGIYLDERRLLCVSPLMTETGNVGFRLQQEGEGKTKVIPEDPVSFHSLSFLTAHQVNLGRDNLLFIGEESVSLTWLRDAVFPVQDPDNYTVDIWLYRLSLTRVWVRTACLASNIPNSGRATVTFPRLEHSATDPRFSAVAIQVALNSSHAEGAELPTAAGLWTTVAFATDTPPTREECNEWAGDTSTRMAEQAMINSRTPACPCTVQQARAPNSGFTEQNMGSPMQLYFNPGAATCFYQSRVNLILGPGKQCCYDERGRLNKGPPAGGHSDVSSVYSQIIPPSVAMAIHLQQDITPFIQCCKSNESSCSSFYTFRPSAESECQHNPQPPSGSSDSVRHGRPSTGTHTTRAVNSKRDAESHSGKDTSSCVVHLINDGVVVNGRDVSIQFLGSRSVRSYLCKMDDGNFYACQSPVRMYNLDSGNHQFEVLPQGCGKIQHSVSVKFTVK